MTKENRSRILFVVFACALAVALVFAALQRAPASQAAVRQFYALQYSENSVFRIEAGYPRQDWISKAKRLAAKKVGWPGLDVAMLQTRFGGALYADFDGDGEPDGVVAIHCGNFLHGYFYSAHYHVYFFSSGGGPPLLVKEAMDQREPGYPLSCSLGVVEYGAFRQIAVNTSGYPLDMPRDVYRIDETGVVPCFSGSLPWDYKTFGPFLMYWPRTAPAYRMMFWDAKLLQYRAVAPTELAPANFVEMFDPDAILEQPPDDFAREYTIGFTDEKLEPLRALPHNPESLLDVRVYANKFYALTFRGTTLEDGASRRGPVILLMCARDGWFPLYDSDLLSAYVFYDHLAYDVDYDDAIKNAAP